MFGSIKKNAYLCTRNSEMVPVVQLVRASDCGSECRGFESHRAPNRKTSPKGNVFFCEKSIHDTSIKTSPKGNVFFCEKCEQDIAG